MNDHVNEQAYNRRLKDAANGEVKAHLTSQFAMTEFAAVESCLLVMIPEFALIMVLLHLLAESHVDSINQQSSLIVLLIESLHELTIVTLGLLSTSLLGLEILVIKWWWARHDSSLPFKVRAVEEVFPRMDQLVALGRLLVG